MQKAEKPKFVKELADNIKAASGVVIVNYNGLSVKMQQDLKKRLQKVDGKMVVIKNTLFKLAAEEAKLPKEMLEDTVLTGPTAYVFAGQDPVGPLQVLHKFAKEFEIPNLKVGVVDGTFQDKMSLEKLATLPSREVLLGQAVGTIAGPMYGIVSTLQGNIQKLLYILKTKATS